MGYAKDSIDAPVVAIIIPSYNDEKYIRECLDSVKAQTVPFWEAWIVDDHSEDKSVEIINEYKKSDERFHVISNPENQSAWTARARGIMAVSPSVEYIMFADADDTLQPCAVEYLWGIVKRKSVDIVHFGTNVINCDNVSYARIRYYDKYLQPPKGELKGIDVLKSFIARDFEGHLWNKMFKTDLLKKVVKDVGIELTLPKAQDKVLYWAVCCTGEDISYCGVKRRLYNYNYGRGVEGTTGNISFEECRKFFAQALSENKIEDITKQSVLYHSNIDKVLRESRYNLIRHSVRNLMRLCNSDRITGFNSITDYWNRESDKVDIVCAMAEYSWNNQAELSDVLCKSDFLKKASKEKIKVVGTFYHRMDNGGIQRVISRIVEIWNNIGYDVILFTDCEPSPDDYPLPDYVVRVTTELAVSACNAENYAKRGRNLAELLKNYNVDCMVYHSYFSDVLLYDTCICKAVNVPFVLYEHNVFSRYLRYNNSKFSTIPKFSRLADSVVCLDDTSAQWWKAFNPNVHKVLNPLTFELNIPEPTLRKTHSILFLCRLAEKAKRPSHAIDIAEMVIKEYPGAKMFVVGSGEEHYVRSLVDKVKKRGLADKIIFEGFTKEVEKYYKECSVFLSCSAHEGFMLTLCEALSYSMPAVMYDLPYLEIVKGNPGIISVPQNDKKAAADAICGLFAEDGLIEKTGRSGRSFLENMYSCDLGEEWKKLFASFKGDYETVDIDKEMVAETIVNDYLAGCTGGGEAHLGLMFKIRRYYRQFGLKRTIKRAFEKLTEG